MSREPIRNTDSSLTEESPRGAQETLHAFAVERETRLTERIAALETANRDLRASNRQLAALNTQREQREKQLDNETQAKSELMSGMSHELRTPLNSIIGFSGTLLGGLAGGLNEEQERQLRMIHRSGSHLLDLVNEVLDLTRIEANRIEVSLTRVMPLEVARECVDTVAPMADEKGLTLRLEGESALPGMVTDPHRLSQVLLNLLANAIKFTDQGGIVLRVATDRAGVLFTVVDTGVGIAPEHHMDIFGRFYRVPLADGSLPEGSGLGLPLVRKLVEALGGQIAFESRVDEGSAFEVWMPGTAAGAAPSSMEGE